jgi:hypothetical protein
VYDLGRDNVTAFTILGVSLRSIRRPSLTRRMRNKVVAAAIELTLSGISVVIRRTLNTISIQLGNARLLILNPRCFP